jgi:hypothetical protein
MATPYHPVYVEAILVETTMWTESAHQRRAECADDDPNERGPTYCNQR